MGVFQAVMDAYPYVFHPAVMVAGMIVLLIYVEWSRQDLGREALRPRIGALLGVGVVSVVPSLLFMLVTGQGPMETMQGNAWQVDALVGSGVLLVAATLWLVWRRYDWGVTVPRGMEALAAVTVPYLALSPVWNVSGHVTLAVVSTLYVTLVERSFWPLLAIPVVMVLNRPFVGAHSWLQSVVAFGLMSSLVLGVYALQRSSDLHVPAESARESHQS